MKESDSSQGGDHWSPEEFEELMLRYLERDLEAKEFAKLQEHLKVDQRARRRFIEVCDMSALLRHVAEEEMAMVLPEPKQPSKNHQRSLLPLLWACSAMAAGLIVLGISLVTRPSVGAAIVDSLDAEWVESPADHGGKLQVGSQLHLASGSVEISFQSGASTRILGPALFEIESGNGGFLHYGKTLSTADNEASKGFSIHTVSGTYVDHGTEFFTEAATDGSSQMFVIRGAVDAQGKEFESRRISGGNGIGFGVGEMPVMVQIEQGADTPEFQFPSIPPPSPDDFASTQKVSIDCRINEAGISAAAPASAPPEVLVNGRAQSSADDPNESFFFRPDSVGYLTFDLGEVRPVSRIHTYSWHRNRSHPEMTLRAVQRFTVWGSNDVLPRDLPRDTASTGWTLICEVDTDVYFQVDKNAIRPTQQACRISPPSGKLGNFRYLLFEMLPTTDYDSILPRHTFFSEIDIFTATDEG
ncbi:MAG: hypothetical protein AAF191_01965 [Verrucomicrobiota bacterium]